MRVRSAGLQGPGGRRTNMTSWLQVVRGNSRPTVRASRGAQAPAASTTTGAA